MPRPCKMRRVGVLPGATYFKPAGIPLVMMSEVCLTVEEAEAVRLKDLVGLEQEAAAGQMNISRATYQRVLTAARRKIADALLTGKAIRIGGGNYELAGRRFRCAHGHEWNAEPVDETEVPVCPTCQRPPLHMMVGPGGGGPGHRGRHGGPSRRGRP